jgi:hypothetical protein
MISDYPSINNEYMNDKFQISKSKYQINLKISMTNNKDLDLGFND